MQLYAYEEVDSRRRQIRLMTLHSRETSDEIRVTLKNVTLNPKSPPSYEALSYAWGSAQDKVPIQIRTAEGIKGTLSESIRRLSKRYRLSTHQVDWRYSSLEVTRNLAVALEHLRYDHKPRALWVDAICINQQDLQERSAQVQLMGDIYRSANQTIVWLGPDEDNSSLALEILDDLGSKIRYDYYTYTYPPVGKSENDDTLANNKKHLPWDQMEWASIRRLLQRPWFERLWIWQEVMLAHHVVVVCGFNCGPQSLGENPLWRPDYRKDVRAVFQEFVLNAIEETQLLKPLLLCDLQKPLPNAPSWVPNLPDSISDRVLDFLEAAGDTRARAMYQGNGILEVSGVLLTSIGDIVHINTPMGGWDNSLYTDLPSELRRLFPLISRNLESDLYPGGGSLVEAFCRTICCNRFHDDDGMRASYPQRFQESFDEFSRLLKVSEGESTEPNSEIYLSNEFLESRSLFTTREGYIGLAPLATKSGDHVSVLFGCPAPIVLRPTDDGSFLVVGQCYIHGFEDGAALLGPFPSAWKRRDRDGDRYFVNRATGTRSLTDPRLGKLPDGWGMVSNHDDGWYAVFEKLSTGEWTFDDPRQTPEAIRALGVDLRTISLK
ncbi:MAG: hypothetical protein Q9207_002478 [Kuettlingeria erythrocarpa]